VLSGKEHHGRVGSWNIRLGKSLRGGLRHRIFGRGQRRLPGARAYHGREYREVGNTWSRVISDGSGLVWERSLSSFAITIKPLLVISTGARNLSRNRIDRLETTETIGTIRIASTATSFLQHFKTGL
jgi:hypothetical protein